MDDYGYDDDQPLIYRDELLGKSRESRDMRLRVQARQGDLPLVSHYMLLRREPALHWAHSVVSRTKLFQESLTPIAPASVNVISA